MDGKQGREVSIDFETIDRVNFACSQNDVPVLRRLSVKNLTDRSIYGLRVTMRTVPDVIREKTWNIESIAPDSEHIVSDTRVEFDVERLAGLNEAERGELQFSLQGDELSPSVERRKIDLLARDQWGGLSDLPQLLAAFVCPNDPSVAKILKSASSLLEAEEHDGSLDGYQSGEPARVYMLAGAIWSAATTLRLSYSETPASFELQGQKIRSPARVVEEGLATCLDTTLFLAAAYEKAGLNPVVLFSENHAWVAVWIQERDFGQVTEPDVVAVRKAVQAHELVPIESTLLTKRPTLGFENAEELGRRRLEEHREAEFEMAVDISRCRAAGILPAASHSPRPQEEGAHIDAVVPAPLPKRPDFGRLPGEEVDEHPQTPKGRIERWQSKLLDLSLRNRLLNFKVTKQTVPLRCLKLASLEDALADGDKFRFTSLTDENPANGRNLSPEERRRIEDEVTLNAFKQKQIAVPLKSEEMDKRLLMLFRRANSDLQEGGTNTLFLAAGFLRWRKADGDIRDYRAPLLLLPVKLERSSVQSKFLISHHDDDVRINFTLLEFLKRDFHLQIPQLEGGLPTDDSGIDVPRVFDLIRGKVRDAAHFEVVEDLALSTFSFSKYLMWKDLVDREDQLRENRLVKHLIDGPEEPFEGLCDNEEVRPTEIDRTHSPSDLFTPLPADSSQLAAVIAAEKGSDFYLVGPPGTGKSQTITNMIAQCLASDKTVLFVAEKAAALNVVHRRLLASGLGDAVLELHSNKTDRKAVVGQLGRGWNRNAAEDDHEWLDVTNKLEVKRDQLNAYVGALHVKGSQGFSVFQAIGRAAKSDPNCFCVSFASKDAHDKQSYHDLVELARNTGEVYSVVRDQPPLALVEREDWSLSWNKEFLEVTSKLRKSLEDLRDAEKALARELGLLQNEQLEASRRSKLRSLAPRMSDAALDVNAVPDASPAQLLKFTERLASDVQDFMSSRMQIQASYPLRLVRRMPINQLDADWRIAQTKLWPASFFARRKVRKLLQTYAERGEANPDSDIDALVRMQERDKAISENPIAQVAGPDGAWDPPLAAEATRQAIELRETLDCLQAAIGDPVKYSTAVNQLSTRSGGSVRTVLESYLASEREFSKCEASFSSLGGSIPSEASAAHIEEGLTRIESDSSRLPDWAKWIQTKNKAVARGLTPLVESLENGQLKYPAAEAFEHAYAAWWLPLSMDDSDELKQFLHWNHEKTIEAFRRLDDRAAQITSNEVMRRIAHRLPAKHNVPKNSELGTLRHQLGLKKPSMPIRALLAKLPETLGKLTPCVLMSPLSVAQYFPAGGSAFDVVIFDEASQITTWDAIGAIARGRQTIVVGDPKQLPPTNFFGRSDDEDEEFPEIERDMPSILDEVAVAGIPERRLDWHYRSRDEALIAFSNRFYYDGRLVTFPAPTARSNALQFHKVDGVYVRGPNERVNHVEAKAVAAMVRERLLEGLRLSEDQRPTLGVITFNSQQQSLIQDLLDHMCRNNPQLEWYFSQDREEPVIVKNLENIQGDERDVMLFSVTFGPDKNGRLTMNFGPLNNEGGERRLNVAVTRSRQELHVFSSILAEEIDLGRTNAQGVRHFKAFLDYAKRGPDALPAYDQGSLGPAESMFEEAVAEALAQKGWEVRTQVGVSGFRLDLAILHPDRAGKYLCGIECDGAQYHSSATARDRDKIRQAVLEGLGWKIVRIWSTDWFRNSEQVAERVHGQIEQLLREDQQLEEEEIIAASAPQPVALETEDDIVPTSSSGKPGGDGANVDLRSPEGPPTARLRPDNETSPLSGTLNGNQFYEGSYSKTLRDVILRIVIAEGPMPFQNLASRVAQEHGWKKAGKRILKRVEECLGTVEQHSEFDRVFVWAPQKYALRVPFRRLAERSVRDLSRAEIASVIDEHERNLAKAEDLPLALSRHLGLSRLSKVARRFLEQCIAWRESGRESSQELAPEIASHPRKSDFREELTRIFEKASSMGEEIVAVRSDDLCQAVAGEQGYEVGLGICCQVMHAEVFEGVDEIQSESSMQHDDSLEILYLLPRPE